MEPANPALDPLPNEAATPIDRSAVASPARRWTVMAAALLAVAHFGWLMVHHAAATMSPDANGYVVQARLLATEGATSFGTTSPVQFVGMHWLETERGTFHSRYPAGLPLLFAAAWKVGGLGAALVINPLLASLTVFLGFLLARRLMPAGFALLAAAVVATIPVANQHALDADAHIAATCFLLGGTLLLLGFEEKARAAFTRRTIFLGFGAGVLLGAVPTIRYPEALVGVTLAGWLLWRVRPVTRIWPAVVGAALPLGALCVHNAAAYGAFWKTGYALTNEQTGFGLQYFTAHALPYLQGLGGQGLALMFAFGAAGIAALAASPRHRGEGVLFAGLVVPLVLLYMAYYFGGGGPGGVGGSLRFLVPTFPFLVVAGAWLLAQLAEHLGRPGRIAVAVVAALQLLIALGGSAQVLRAAKASLGAAARARALAEKEVPAGSILIVERTLAESLDAVGRWKLVEENFLAGFGGPGAGGPGGFGRPGGPGRGFVGGRGGPGTGPEMDDAGDRPSPMQVGKNQAQQERYAGLRPDERRQRAWTDLSAWAAGKPVYCFSRSLDSIERMLPTGADYRSVAEIDAPTMMMGPMAGTGGGAGRGGGMPAGRGGPGGFGPGGGRGPGMAPGRGGAGAPGMGAGRGGVDAASTKLRLVEITLPAS